MQKEKYYLTMDSYEQDIIFSTLNDKRNRLIHAGRPTDAVDDLLIKIAKARRKKDKRHNLDAR